MMKARTPVRAFYLTFFIRFSTAQIVNQRIGMSVSLQGYTIDDLNFPSLQRDAMVSQCGEPPR
jgi:hypothetical protein